MAHTILGIDLGSYSVKLAQLQAGFRTVKLLSLHERPLAPPLAAPETGAPAIPGDAGAAAQREESLLERQVRTLEQMLAELGGRPEMTAVALSEEVTMRVIDLPLSDPRKVEQVLPFELEGQLLGEIEDQIIDHIVAQTGLAREDDGTPAGKGTAQGSRVLAAAAPRAKVQELIGRLSALGLEPRLCGAAALDCAALFAAAGRAPAQTGVLAGAAADLPAVVLDLGHLNTHFCVVDKREQRGVSTTFARTIGRGGFHLSASVARALSIEIAAAERLKHEIGLSPPVPGGQAVQAGRVQGALRDGLRPLIRDLRQTLASYVSVYGEAPPHVLLTGGGSRLRGLGELLSEELSLQVLPLDPEALGGTPWLSSGLSSGLAEGTDIDLPGFAARFPGFTAALGLGLSLTVPAPQVNFRKGELAYRTDYSFLREKAPHLMVAALAILLCAGLSAVAQLRGLQRESDQLAGTLRNETTALFGSPHTDGDWVLSELNSVLQSGKGQSVPATSAFDLLDEISRAAPAGPLDVVELSIRPKVTEIKATASSAQYVDDLVTALSKIPCFKQIDKGKVVSVKNTGADGKPVDAKQFSLTITTTCP